MLTGGGLSFIIDRSYQMSSILFTNPYTPQGPAVTPPAAAPALAVAPAQNTAASQDQGGATAFSGSGTGNSSQSDTVALLRTLKDAAVRPQMATSGSVINAQVEPKAVEIYTTSNLPEVKMPDPLPTSPFLKPA
jgi:hypothetical protein